MGGRFRVVVRAWGCALVAWACAAASPVLSPASAVNQRSANVAIVDGTGAGSVGTLQTGGEVEGAPGDSFEGFLFTFLEQEEVQPGALSSYDTVVLNEVFTSELSEAQKQALADFVTSGGKLIIHDADGTEGNEYSWLPVPATTGVSCLNCGSTNGSAVVEENNTIVNDDPSSPFYIDVAELPGNSDAIGDANFLLTSDPRWTGDVRGSNDQNVEGAMDAYASDGGLILYNGFDYDYLGNAAAFPSGVDWLDKLWWNELSTQWNPDALPHSVPVVGFSGHCGFKSVRVGVASVCAESISGSVDDTVASGNVVLDGGIAVGNGPVTIDQTSKQISVPATTLTLLRSGTPLSLGTAALTIDATGATDPISGKPNLARVSLTGASLALGALRAGGLPLSVPSVGSLSMYMTTESGGGLIAAGSVQLPAVKKLQSSAALSLGFFAGSPAAVVPLGGGAHFGAVTFAKGWKLDGLDLSYQGATNTWSASGGLEIPLADLHASGSVVSGRLDALHVGISGLNIPVGDSGFFFSGFGGGVSGLANGPLNISADTEGFWGVPKAPVEPFYLDNVSVTASLGGSIALDGAVSLILKEHSPLHGQLHLKLGFFPFSAHGSASVEGSLPGVTMKAHGGAGFTAKHFTATEGGELSVFGLSGSGEIIASDKGLGASGTLCAPFHVVCKTVAFAGTWSQLGKFDIPALIGGQPQKLVTVTSAAADTRSASLNVPAGRSLLLLAVTGPTQPSEITLIDPRGHRYRAGGRSRKVIVRRQPQFELVTIAVLAPRRGRWRIEAGSEGGPLEISAQTAGSIRLIRTRAVTPASSPAGRWRRTASSCSAGEAPTFRRGCGSQSSGGRAATKPASGSREDCRPTVASRSGSRSCGPGATTSPWRRRCMACPSRPCVSPASSGARARRGRASTTSLTATERRASARAARPARSGCAPIHLGSPFATSSADDHGGSGRWSRSHHTPPEGERHVRVTADQSPPCRRPPPAPAAGDLSSPAHRGREAV